MHATTWFAAAIAFSIANALVDIELLPRVAFTIVLGGSYGRATRDYTDYLNAANNASKEYDWFAPRVGLIWESEGGTQIYANVTFTPDGGDSNTQSTSVTLKRKRAK